MQELIDRILASIAVYIVVFTMYYFSGFERTLLATLIAMYVAEQYNRG